MKFNRSFGQFISLICIFTFGTPKSVFGLPCDISSIGLDLTLLSPPRLMAGQSGSYVYQAHSSKIIVLSTVHRFNIRNGSSFEITSNRQVRPPNFTFHKIQVHPSDKLQSESPRGIGIDFSVPIKIIRFQKFYDGLEIEFSDIQNNNFVLSLKFENPPRQQSTLEQAKWSQTSGLKPSAKVQQNWNSVQTVLPDPYGPAYETYHFQFYTVQGKPVFKKTSSSDFVIFDSEELSFYPISNHKQNRKIINRPVGLTIDSQSTGHLDVFMMNGVIYALIKDANGLAHQIIEIELDPNSIEVLNSISIDHPVEFNFRILTGIDLSISAQTIRVDQIINGRVQNEIHIPINP